MHFLGTDGIVCVVSGSSLTCLSRRFQIISASLKRPGAIKGYTLIVDYGRLGYDVTGILQLKVEGPGLLEITETLRDEPQMKSVYETTGDYDIIAIGKFIDTEEMNEQIKRILAGTEVQESNTSVVLNTVNEYDQFNVGDDQDS